MAGRDDNLDDEIQSHLNMAIQDRIARGQSPEEARAGALREFGNVGLVKETTRAVWVSTVFEQLGQDLRAATRILTKSAGLSAAAIALVALGIGWNATIYSMIHGLLTKPAPGIQADRLVSFGITIPWRNGRTGKQFSELSRLRRADQSIPIYPGVPVRAADAWCSRTRVIGCTAQQSPPIISIRCRSAS